MHLSVPILLYLPFHVATAGHHLDDPDLFHFVTRSDLRAPRWDITIYSDSNSQLSPGYWFIAPKQSRRQLINTRSAWIGPHIYSADGELVWSGATQLDTANVNDFRMSMVDGPGGEQMLTFFDRDREAGVVLDSHYRVRSVLDLHNENVNAHEFNVVNNGRSALVLKNDVQEMTQREKDVVGVKGGCTVQYTRFQEIEITSDGGTGEVVFEFDSRGKIGVDETREWLKDGDVSAQCKSDESDDVWWDFLHGNSVDKCPDGDYLFGSRFLSTIYKISADTGEIVWRLGGLRSDFNVSNDMAWSQQHDVSCQRQNETHTIISLLDNQVSPYVKVEDAERGWSRGLVISVNEVDMTAGLLASYDHPRREYAPRRGNLQILDNGNVFIGWSERALHSEHSANGSLLMQAQLKAKWMGSYRNYKFEFTGKPLMRPDVVARTYFWPRDNATTHVYVSWNGDTRVRRWRLYSTLANDPEIGSGEDLLAEVKREGFETFLESPTYAEYVKVQGVDVEGNVVQGGESAVVKTEEHPSSPDSVEAGRVFAEIELNAGFENPHGQNENEKEEDPEPGGYANTDGQVWKGGVYTFFIAATCFVLGSLTRPWLLFFVARISERFGRWKSDSGENYEYEEVAMHDGLQKEVLDSDDDGDDLMLCDDGLMDGNLDTFALPDR